MMLTTWIHPDSCHLSRDVGCHKREEKPGRRLWGKQFSFPLMPHQGFMTTATSPKTLQSEPGSVLPIQCQDLREKLLEVVRTVPAMTRVPSPVGENFRWWCGCSLPCPVCSLPATGCHSALKLLLVWMINSTFNFLNLNLDLNNCMWLSASVVDRAGPASPLVFNQCCV